MRKRWLIAGLALGGVAAMLVRRKCAGGYEHDTIDSAGAGDTFGERGTPAPEQALAHVETRRGVTAEQLATAARVETSMDAIRATWPPVTADEIAGAEDDFDRLAYVIAQKVEQPFELVRAQLDAIIAQEAPAPSYPAH